MDIRNFLQEVQKSAPKIDRIGYKTTEFGMATALVSYLISRDGITNNWVYAALATGVVVCYGILRTVAKK